MDILNFYNENKIMTVRNYIPYNDMRFVRFPSSFGTDPDNVLMPRLLVYMFKREDGDLIYLY